MFQPIPFDTFGGMATRWSPEKLPTGFSTLAKNVKFLGNSVQTRDGISPAFTTLASAAVTGLSQFFTLAGEHVPVAFDASGEMVKEMPSGSGGTVSIESGIGTNLYMEADTAQNKLFVAFSDLQATPGATPRVYFKAADGNFYLDEVGLAPNTSPVVGSAASAVAGDIPEGVRYCVVLYKTRTGYIGGMTDASVFPIILPDSTHQVTIGLPIGPANCVARIVAFTEAGASSAGPYYWIAEDDDLQELTAPITKTIVEDNTATLVDFNFTDDYLVGTEDVTSYFDKVQLPSQVGVFFSPTLRRMIWAGEDRNIFRVSAADDLETYFGATGFVYPGQGDGQRAITAREFRGEVYLLKDDSGYSVAESSTEPWEWKTIRRWDKVGPYGARALDVCDSFMVIAAPSGLYSWDGATMTWLSMEVSGSVDNGDLSWDRINKDYAHLVYVFIDEVAKEIRIGVPLDVATTISHEFVLNYAGGLGKSRKWSYNTLQFTTMMRLKRAIAGVDLDNRVKMTQLCGASANPDGQIVMIDPSNHTDNTNAINSAFQTRYDPPPTYGTIYQLGGVGLSVKGSGQLVTQRAALDGKLTPLRTISLDATKYVDHALRPTAQHERFSFKLSVNGAGDWFAVQRITGYVNTAWQRRTF